jgi:hypothetical protein
MEGRAARAAVFRSGRFTCKKRERSRSLSETGRRVLLLPLSLHWHWERRKMLRVWPRGADRRCWEEVRWKAVRRGPPYSARAG